MRDEIPFTLRNLERWIAWSVAACTAFTTVLLYRDITMLWAFVAYAGLVGKWALVNPAWRQVQLVARAVALLAGAFLVHVYVGSEISAIPGSLYFWFAIPTLCYAFMLGSNWAWFVVMLALASYVLAWVEVRTHDAWLPMLAQAGMLLLITPLLGMRFGNAMRGIEDAMEEGLRDRATGLYNKAGLLRHGQELLDTLENEGQAMCMVLVNAGAAERFRDAPDRRAARKAVSHLARHLTGIAGKRGLAARTGALEFVLLLPRTKDKALLAVERGLSAATETVISGTGVEFALTPAWSARVVEPKAQSLQELFDELRGQEQARDEPAGPFQVTMAA
jgi:GGDEF domain-containing protein